MTIVYGYKVQQGTSYFFAKDMQAVDDGIKRNDWSESSCAPCRYFRANRWSIPVEIVSGEEYRALYKMFARGVHITTASNENAKHQHPDYLLWDNTIESGKNYLVGREVSTKAFLATHTTAMSDWQVIAHEWAVAHPDEMLVITTGGRRKFVWHVNLEGDHVVFGLPYHDAGGEKHYVSHIDNPTRKVLVNVD